MFESAEFDKNVFIDYIFNRENDLTYWQPFLGEVISGLVNLNKKSALGLPECFRCLRR
jgi:hypothetical protein